MFNPKVQVRIGDTSITLAQYAARMYLQLIKASNLNKRLHDNRIDQYVTIQKIWRFSKDKDEVREIFTKIWNQPQRAKELLSELSKGTKNSLNLK